MQYFQRSYPIYVIRLTDCILFLHVLDRILALQIRVEIVAKVGAAIVESQLFVKSRDLFHIFCAELEVTLVVILNALWRLGLWQNRIALSDAPC